MSEPVDLPEIDTDPDQWVDHEDFFTDIGADEQADGNRLGEAIDADDDDDNGGVGDE